MPPLILPSAWDGLSSNLARPSAKPPAYKNNRN